MFTVILILSNVVFIVLWKRRGAMLDDALDALDKYHAAGEDLLQMLTECEEMKKKLYHTGMFWKKRANHFKRITEN